MDICTPTPRTDAEEFWHIDGHTLVRRDFARELERENAELREVATRLFALRSAASRVDLTDSSKRSEVYSLVARAAEILK